MNRLLATLAVTSLLVASGCGTETDPSPQGGLEGSISFSRGGGIAGEFFDVTIAPDGSGTLQVADPTGSEPEPERFELSGDELDEIAQLAIETPFGDIGEATNPSCADCFVYTVSYGGESLTVDSSTLEEAPGSEAAPLIEALGGAAPDQGPA